MAQGCLVLSLEVLTFGYDCASWNVGVGRGRIGWWCVGSTAPDQKGGGVLEFDRMTLSIASSFNHDEVGS